MLSNYRHDTFNTQAIDILDTRCWQLQVTNYGKNKTTFNFYTRSKAYAYVKRNIILKASPEAVVVITAGAIEFKSTK